MDNDNSICRQCTMSIALTYFPRLCKWSAISLATSASSRTEHSLFQLPYGLIGALLRCLRLINRVITCIVWYWSSKSAKKLKIHSILAKKGDVDHGWE
ncbi:hypothetical protein MVEN_01752100 [Mycena venus]|uniref:Uncharacterized protein n=1 Tax=Mycena venus TaxID=2733690 RepID=A0A8H7CMH5_9AGAR|nr:hypothetical protein MVEN_01752100 [Mycena venus]